MSNILTTNPMQLDTEGATSLLTGEQLRTRGKIQALTVYAANDSWELVLKDASGGNIIFRAGQATGSGNLWAQFTFPFGWSPAGFYFDGDSADVSLLLVHFVPLND
jgi:hypothetical protein